MDDMQIVDLFWARSEEAISAASKKYGKYCFSIAYHILGDAQDAEESVNDTYLDAWNAMPPHRPRVLAAFLGKITRRRAIDKWRGRTAEKRGGGQMRIALDELGSCIPAGGDPARMIDGIALTQILDQFLSSLRPEARKIFLQRYWYLLSVREISKGLGVSESKVKMSLLRARNELKLLLEKEAFSL